MIYLVALAGLILGAVCGYVLRREIVETTTDDSGRRLKELRQLHASCGDRIRTLSMQVGQLESEIARHQVETIDRPDRRPSVVEAAMAPWSEPVPEPVTEPSEPVSSDTNESRPIEELIDVDGLPTDVESPVTEVAVTEVAVTEGAAPDSPVTDSPVTAPPLTASEQAGPGDALSIDLGSLERDETSPLGEGTPLTEINGIGNISAVRLAAAGVESLEDLAALEPADVKRLSSELGRMGQRMVREDWIGAARRTLEERASASS